MLATLALPDGSPCQLNVERWGDASGSPLFCVHGLTRNAMDFEVLSEALTPHGFQLIAPDMPGRGKSPRLANPALYNNAVNALLCAQLIRQLGFAQVDWMGTSMGGLIALVVANQFPGLIHKLILNDVGTVVTAASLKRIGEYVGTNPAYPSLAEAEAALKLRTAPFGIPESRWQRFAENSIEKTGEGYRIAYDPAIGDAFKTTDEMKDIELWPLWEKVKEIPTLLIRGEHSDLLTEETAQAMQRTHPHLTRYNVPGAGHAPALMTAEETGAILDFVTPA